MSDVSTFLAGLQAELDASTARDATFLGQALARSLKRASTVRTLFMEASFTFMTTALQQDYPTGRRPGTLPYVGPTPAITPPAGYVVGVPPDFQEMDSFYVLAWSTFGLPGIPIRRGTIEQIRASALRVVFAGIYTGLWTFHHEAILLGPTPAGAQQLAGDYLRDATRDAATGALITGASGSGISNPWFTEGEFALRALVMRDFHRGNSKDAQQADWFDEEWKEACSIFSTAVSQAKSASAQAPPSFGEENPLAGIW